MTTPEHDLTMPHDIRYADDDPRHCPPNCPARPALEQQFHTELGRAAEPQRFFDAALVAAQARRHDEDPLGSVIGQLAGFASMCWDDMAGTGVFHSEEARDAVDSTIEWLRGQFSRVTRVRRGEQLVLLADPAADLTPQVAQQIKDRLVNDPQPVTIMGGIHSVLVVEPEQRDLYVAGPMTGMPEYNYPAFFAAAEQLAAAGYTVGNPAEDGQVEGWEWTDYLRRAVRLMLTCSGVALLEGWENSTGAQLEVHVARAVGMDVAPVGEWLEAAGREQGEVPVSATGGPQ